MVGQMVQHPFILCDEVILPLTHPVCEVILL